MSDTITLGTRTIPVIPNVADVREAGWHAQTETANLGGARVPRSEPILVRLYDDPTEQVNAVGEPLQLKAILMRDTFGQWVWNLSTITGGVLDGALDIAEALNRAERAIDEKLRVIRSFRDDRDAEERDAQPDMEGLTFPAAVPASPRLAKEWCEIGTVHGRGVVLSRNGMSGWLTVTPRARGGWAWTVLGEEVPQQTLASGDCDTLPGALTTAEQADADQHLQSGAARPGDAELLAATIARNAANRAAAQADHAWRTAIRDALASGMSGSLVASRVGTTDKRVYQIRDNTR